jgi:hypothetical protein
MNLHDAQRWLQELTETQQLQTLTVHGGEPFLYLDALVEILKSAHKLNIPQRWVITNGFWATTEAIARQYLRALKDAGLTCITVSADAFHQEYVPLKKIRNCITAALDLDFKRVCVDSYFVIGPHADNLFDTSTSSILERLGALPGAEINQYRAGFDGRATDYLVEFVEPKLHIPDGKCRLPAWLGGNLKNPEACEIDFEGNVTLCPGICIGNCKHESLAHIINHYNYHHHPIIRVIAQQGPRGLLTLAQENGYKADATFVNECHLCYEMRRFLHTFYPHHLAPQACY